MILTEELRVYTQINRARRYGSIATLTLSEWKQTIADFNGMCAYCNIRPFWALEHFIPFGQKGDGTHVNNCLPACRPCNNRKKDRPLEVLILKFGKETIERLQAYLASRTPQADESTLKVRRTQQPRPTSSEERRKIRIYGGIDGREPQYGDEIELQGKHGIVRRKVDCVTSIHHQYNRSKDYDVRLLPLVNNA